MPPLRDQSAFEFVPGKGDISKEMHVQILRGNTKM